MVHVGSTYQGIIEWDSCETMHDHNIILTVTAVKHEQIFNNVVYVRATLIGDSVRFKYAHPVATAMHGYYEFATRELHLVPDHLIDDVMHHPYDVVCQFNLGDTGHADCTVHELASHFQCGHMRFVKV